ncbi:hypothetical protein [Actinomadura sp. DC4]|uniref:hypothetical protein n=1 Tax=Actinomadura sp. DC4 TaxID=3055069 RepID=UPI0025AF223C|nr:hypothetical protein [Actinomadura sp. DC4]MDN3358792.1 hypothetical protein [Actinomadura sp. DC4]
MSTPSATSAPGSRRWPMRPSLPVAGIPRVLDARVAIFPGLLLTAGGRAVARAQRPLDV